MASPMRRGPFHVSGRGQELLELPPLTYRALGFNLPVAGGGYFRLFPLGILRWTSPGHAKRTAIGGNALFPSVGV